MSDLRTSLSVDNARRIRIIADIAGRTFEEDLIQQPGIESNYEALNEALATSSGRFAVWALLEAAARRQHDDAIADANVVEARLYQRYWAQMTDVASTARGKLVQASVTQDPDYQAAQLRVRDAKEQLDMVSAGRKTIEKRGDTLITIATNWRAEMQNRLQVRANEYKARI